jgi:diadenosine tetraphosphate (Ap4A) HIT family hydrolase
MWKKAVQMSERVEAIVRKGVSYDAISGEVVSCLFCRIQQRLEPGRIVYENENYVVFHTIQPVTHLHLLVTPREHISNVKGLKTHPDRIRILQELKEVGKIALGEYAEGAQFSFHIPPFNSIDHLHLHAIASPETMSAINKTKYPSSTIFGYCKSVDRVLEEFQS